MKNIIIFGEAGAGKSTIASILEQKGYKKLSLGAKIHSECRLHGSESREEMQAYGQMMRTIFGINVWCDYLINQFDKTVVNDGIVIDDGRQLNELEYFHARDFVSIGVKTDFETRRSRILVRDGKLLTEEHNNHETEIQARAAVEKSKIIISNDEDLADLTMMVDSIYRNILED